MEKIITSKFLSRLKVGFSKFMNILIIIGTLTAGFGIGYSVQEFKLKADIINETILNKSIRIAIDTEDKLLIMDRKTGQYAVYSDSVGKEIFKMYASKMVQ